MKTGLYGGTFDPIHKGHLHAARKVLKLLKLDQILFIPAASPPHKKESHITSFEKRMEWLKKSIEGQKKFSCSDIENRESLSYTVDLCRSLKENSEDEFYFIMGSDMSGSLSTWKDPEIFLKLVKPVVLIRKGCIVEIDPNLPEELKNTLAASVLEFDTLPISSTQIRQLIKMKQSIKGLVAEAILKDVEKTFLNQKKQAI